MFRSSVSSLARQASRQALAGPSPACAAPATLSSSSLARRSRQWQAQLRAYSEQSSEAGKTTDSAPPKDGAQEASTSAEQSTGTPADEQTKKLQAQLEKAEKDAASFKDNWRRSVADFENLQKRTVKEKKDAKDYAIERFAKDIIGNMEILELALRSVPEARRAKDATQSAAEGAEPNVQDNLADLYTGVSMTAKELEKTLQRYDVKPYDPTGEKFDPNFHEAMYQAPIPGKEPGTVLECSSKGWKLGSRVLRAAQVGVVMEQS